jgi:uncharacterized protein
MQHAGITKVDTEFAGPFCYRRFDDRYLLTNDLGQWHFVAKDDFKSFVEGSLDTGSETYASLKTKGFIHGEIDLEETLRSMRKRYAFLQEGPSRHTLGLTSIDGSGNMDRTVGERAIDMAFISTAQRLEFVFAGGRGNFNWDVLTGLTDFAKNKNRLARKEVRLVLRGDLGGLTEEQIQWLLSQDFHFEADVDSATLSGEVTGLRKAITQLNETLASKGADNRVHIRISPSAETMKLGPTVVDTVLGVGSSTFAVLTSCEGQPSPDTASFGAFYSAVLAKALETNSSETPLTETTAAEFLTRIISGCEASPSETRSPGTDGIGELAYGWDGTVYSSNEGRFVGEAGDEIFALGNVNYNGYHDLMTHPTIRALVLASVGDGQPGYSSWVYKPFCGPRPSKNYIDQGSVQGRAADSKNFLNNQVILDSLFTLLGAGDSELLRLEAWTLA